MKRRSLLRASAGTTFLTVSGCVSVNNLVGNDSVDHESPVPLEDINPPTLEGPCDPVAHPLSAMLRADRGDPDTESLLCFDAATTGLAIENERDNSITLTVDIESAAGEDVFEASYTLEPNERVVERDEIPADPGLEVTVVVDGDESAVGSWAGTSCFRYGIAIVPDGVAVGYIEPFAAAGDTAGNQDCYAGDDSFLVIFNNPDDPSPETVHVRIHDRCTDETFEQTLDMEPDGVKQVTGVLKLGGEFEVTVDVDGGGSATRVYRPPDMCGGTRAAIREDGSVFLSHVIA